MSEQLYRQIQILRVLSRYPKFATTKQLEELLKRQGFNFVKETVQRDVNKLCVAFRGAIDKESYEAFYARTGVSMEGDKSQHVFWTAESKPFSLANLSVNQALSLSLLQKFLTPLMPQSTLDDLEVFFDEAAATLANLSENSLSQWPKKIAIVNPTQPLLTPSIDADIHATITEALLSDQQLQLRYRRSDGVENDYQVNPLGLVLRSGCCYLVATKTATHEKRIFALHRILQAKTLESEVVRPDDCDLQHFIDQGHMGFDLTGAGSYGLIRLKAIFDPITANHLSESRLSEDQVIKKLDDQHFEISATVQESEQLFWWLLSFGFRVEVLEPLHLRKKMADSVKVLAEKYRVD